MKISHPHGSLFVRAKNMYGVHVQMDTLNLHISRQAHRKNEKTAEDLWLGDTRINIVPRDISVRRCGRKALGANVAAVP